MKRIICRIIIGLGIFILGFGLSFLFFNGWECFPPSNKITDFQTLGIWVGSLGTIGAFVGVIITTNKQIKNSNINLQKQIENQNREMNRPYIRVIGIQNLNDDIHNKYDSKILDGYLCFNSPKYKKYKKNNESELTNTAQIVINIDNLGSGIACNFYLAGIMGVTYESEDNIFVCDKSFNGKDIPKNTEYLQFFVNCAFKKHGETTFAKDAEDTLSFLMFYSDIYGHVYSSFISIRLIIRIDNKANPSLYPPKFSVYNQGSKLFENILKEKKVNYNKQVKIYENLLLSSKDSQSGETK